MRARGAGEIVEPQSQDDGAADAVGDAHPLRHAVDEPEKNGVDRIHRARLAAERSLRADRSAAAARLDRPGIAIVRERVQVTAGGPAEQPDERRLGELRDVADASDAARAELRGRRGTDAPQPFDRKRMEERELAVRRNDEQAVGLRHAACHLGEELGARDPDRDRKAHLFAYAAS